MTRSKQESTAVMRLVNLTTKRDSVFMAFSFGVGPKPTPFSREDAVFAHPFWLRLCRVRNAEQQHACLLRKERPDAVQAPTRLVGMHHQRVGQQGAEHVELALPIARQSIKQRVGLRLAEAEVLEEIEETTDFVERQADDIDQ